MKKPILLIAGVMTSGKTTLAKSLVEHGVYDFMMELDTIKEWTAGGKLRMGKLWNEHPSLAKRITTESSRYAGVMLNTLPNVVVSGVWPGEVNLILERVQDWRLIVLKTPVKEEAWTRWLQRSLRSQISGDEDEVKRIRYDFDMSPWGKDSWWDEFRVKMVDFAKFASRKNKLVNLSDILGTDLANHSDFSIIRTETI